MMSSTLEHLGNNLTDDSTPTDGLLNMTTTFSGNTTTQRAVSGGSGGGLPWDNPSNIMSKETSDEITFALQCFVFPILTVFGITGNVLSMVVMLQKKLRNSTTTIVLIGLAISDILFLSTNMIRKSSCMIKEFDKILADAVNAMTFRYAFYLKTSFSRVSTLLVVVISVERLIAVAFPLSIRTVVTKTRMMCVVIGCYVLVLASLAGIPPQYTHATVGGRTYIAQTDFSLDNVDSLKIYNEYFLTITFRYIPGLVVLFLNIAIIILLRRSKQFQKKTASQASKRDEDQGKITRMLLTVSLIFLICLLPGDIVLIAADVIDGFGFFGKYHNVFLAVSDLSLLFEILNSSVNFIIYMVLNRRFNEIYKQLFCSCFQRIMPLQSSRKEMSNTTDSTKQTSSGAYQISGKKIQELEANSTSGYDGSDCQIGADPVSSHETKGHDNLTFEE